MDKVNTTLRMVSHMHLVIDSEVDYQVIPELVVLFTDYGTPRYNLEASMMDAETYLEMRYETTKG